MRQIIYGIFEKYMNYTNNESATEACAAIIADVFLLMNQHNIDMDPVIEHAKALIKEGKEQA